MRTHSACDQAQRVYDGRGWRLSPGYDIVSFPQVGTERDLAIGVGRNGRRATVQNALTEVASFGLSYAEGASLARKMQQVVKANWERLCSESGFRALEIERLRTCFIACDETIHDLA
jgi:serine/threonine-protein kinase HipA